MLAGVTSFSELEKRLGSCEQNDWRELATQRWTHALAGVDACGYGDGDFIKFVREVRNLGSLNFLGNLSKGVPIRARAAVHELADVLAELSEQDLPAHGPEDKNATSRDSIAQLLMSNSLNQAQEALDIIEAARRETNCDAAGTHVLDQYEAEALRQQACYHAEAGRYSVAIEAHLKKAIRLHPGRAQLYADRARYRLQEHCPGLPQEGAFPTESAHSEAMRAAGDCELALALDPSLADAYDLILPVRFAQADLAAAERLLDCGESAVSDSNRAETLREHGRLVRFLRQGVEEVEALLQAADKQPARVRKLVNELSLAAGERLGLPFRQKLQVFMKSAAFQQRAMSHDTESGVAAWEDTWGDLFDKKSRVNSEHGGYTTSVPGQTPPRTQPQRDSGATHGWGRTSRTSCNDWMLETPKEQAVQRSARPRSYEDVIAELSLRLDAVKCSLAGTPHKLEKQRMLRQLFLEWHSDKRQGEEVLATKVFQWLQTVKAV
eukprot:TRINITY_DN77849_c0_g1_i1.p1 TRINITY_DN77849_c0_g1~~TRINITY_DN77849_c0_g1_i1.p1  ORF type:complete len:494 (-),score=100.79 TRINITY_DN77849_c0_g1_i1:244-1725(-)